MLNLAAFAPHVGQTFQVDIEGRPPFPLVLMDAAALPSRLGPGRIDPFQLRFRSVGPMMLLQGTHRLSYAGLGEMDLFLVPLGPEEGGFAYQAIFS